MDPKALNKIINFFNKYESKTFNKGELLIKPHKEPDGVFCLTAGLVRMYSISKTGAETTLNTFRPISLFPMGWVVTGKDNTYYFDAISDVTVNIAPKSKVLPFLKREHTVVFDLLARIYKGLDGYFLRMESLLSGNAYYKTVTQLVINTKRFGQKLPKGNSYLLALTHSKLASLAGITRETATRQMRELQKKNFVTYKGKKLIILDLEKLETELV